MPEVVLHVGAFKTGTTFLQTCLRLNRDRLQEHGILAPAPPGAGPGAESAGALRSWEEFVRTCRSWDGERVIISAESLSTMRTPRVRRAITSLAPMPVRVVYAARDLPRVIPAQWQSSLRGPGRTWAYRAYVRAVVDSPGFQADAAAGPAKEFWSKHDWPAILRRWRQSLPAERVALLTVPPPGADPALLWHRFGEAGGFDAGGYEVPGPVHESMGATSAELMRRANLAIAERRLDPGKANALRRRMKYVLARGVLIEHRGAESRVVFPPEQEEWARQRTAAMLDEVGAIGPCVVGTLEDLQVRQLGVRPGETTTPEDAPLRDLVETADWATARLTGRPPIGGPSEQSEQSELDHALRRLIRAVRASELSRPNGDD